MILIKQTEVGALGSFEWSPDIERVGMMRSLSTICIFPLLHNNTNKFLGMGPKDVYLTHKIIKDKIHTFSQQGKLKTWDFITGKFIKKVQLTDHNYSNYRQVCNYKDGSVLLVSKDLAID